MFRTTLLPVLVTAISLMFLSNTAWSQTVILRYPELIIGPEEWSGISPRERQRLRWEYGKLKREYNELNHRISENNAKRRQATAAIALIALPPQGVARSAAIRSAVRKFEEWERGNEAIGLARARFRANKEAYENRVERYKR